MDTSSDSIGEQSTTLMNAVTPPARVSDSVKQSKAHCSGRKKRPCDSGENMKERNQRRKLQPHLTGAIRFYTKTEEEKNELFSLVEQVKQTMSETPSSVSNYEALLSALKAYLCDAHVPDGNDPSDQQDLPGPKVTSRRGYQYVGRDKADEELFLTTESAIKSLIEKLDDHFTECDQDLSLIKTSRFGHVCKMEFSCCVKSCSSVKWDSSPHIEGGKYYANVRMIHAYLTSGLRKVQYDRFATEASIGTISESSIDSLLDLHTTCTEKAANESMTRAIGEEQFLSKVEAEDNNRSYQGIDIITDARHQWRKNAACSDIVAIGDKTKKVINVQTVHKSEEKCSQRHEMYGTEKLYEFFTENNIDINVHAHDRNASINKYLADKHPNVTNANDTWHLAKGISKEVKKIANGPQYLHGKTWHGQLSDKVAAIKTHCYWAMKTCEGSVETLRMRLDNIVEHYKDNHGSCHNDSPCCSKVDYQPSKTKITDPIAESLLSNAIVKLQMYKHPEDYLHCRDTHYVESFNNALLIYHDKRIVFSPQEYRRRTLLSVLDWNENIVREPTSVILTEDAKNPRRKVGKKVLPKKLYKFSVDIWTNFMDIIYSKV